MAISSSTSLSDLEALKQKVDDLAKDAKTAKGQYNADMTTLSNSINTINGSFAGVWEDDVSEALKGSLDDVKTSCFAYIYNDFIGGGYAELIRCLTELSTKLGTIIGLKKERDTKAYKKANMKSTDPDYYKISSRISTLDGDISNAVGPINTLLSRIQELKLGSNLSDVGSEQLTTTAEEEPQEQKTRPPAGPTRAEMEADGTYSADGGPHGDHFTTYEDYLASLRRKNLRLEPGSTDYDMIYRATIDGANSMATPTVWIAEFNYPPYVINGQRMGDPVEIWRANQTQSLADRARLGI